MFYSLFFFTIHIVQFKLLYWMMNRYAFLSIWKAFVMICFYSSKQNSLWISISTTDARTSIGHQLVLYIPIVNMYIFCRSVFIVIYYKISSIFSISKYPLSSYLAYIFESVNLSGRPGSQRTLSLSTPM